MVRPGRAQQGAVRGEMDGETSTRRRLQGRNLPAKAVSFSSGNKTAVRREGHIIMMDIPCRSECSLFMVQVFGQLYLEKKEEKKANL